MDEDEWFSFKSSSDENSSSSSENFERKEEFGKSSKKELS
jgi:hypothetical protein